MNFLHTQKYVTENATHQKKKRKKIIMKENCAVKQTTLSHSKHNKKEIEWKTSNISPTKQVTKSMLLTTHRLTNSD